MNQQLRQMVMDAIAFGDVMDQSSLGVAAFGQEEKTSRFIRADLVKFLLYLSASDDVISEKETAFFRDYLGYNFETSTITSLVEQFGLKKDEFLNEIPFSMYVMIEADSKVISYNGENPGSAMALLAVYHALGSAFAACDDAVAEEEKKDFSAYLSMLKEQIILAENTALEAYKAKQAE